MPLDINKLEFEEIYKIPTFGLLKKALQAFQISSFAYDLESSLQNIIFNKSAIIAASESIKTLKKIGISSILKKIENILNSNKKLDNEARAFICLENSCLTQANNIITNIISNYERVFKFGEYDFEKIFDLIIDIKKFSTEIRSLDTFPKHLAILYVLLTNEDFIKKLNKHKHNLQLSQIEEINNTKDLIKENILLCFNVVENKAIYAAIRCLDEEARIKFKQSAKYIIENENISSPDADEIRNAYARLIKGYDQNAIQLVLTSTEQIFSSFYENAIRETKPQANVIFLASYSQNLDKLGIFFPGFCHGAARIWAENENQDMFAVIKDQAIAVKIEPTYASVNSFTATEKILNYQKKQRSARQITASGDYIAINIPSPGLTFIPSIEEAIEIIKNSSELYYHINNKTPAIIFSYSAIDLGHAHAMGIRMITRQMSDKKEEYFFRFFDVNYGLFEIKASFFPQWLTKYMEDKYSVDQIPIYKVILLDHKPTSITQFSNLEPELYSNIKWMMNNSVAVSYSESLLREIANFKNPSSMLTQCSVIIMMGLISDIKNTEPNRARDYYTQILSALPGDNKEFLEFIFVILLGKLTLGNLQDDDFYHSCRILQETINQLKFELQKDIEYLTNISELLQQEYVDYKPIIQENIPMLANFLRVFLFQEISCLFDLRINQIYFDTVLRMLQEAIELKLSDKQELIDFIHCNPILNNLADPNKEAWLNTGIDLDFELKYLPLSIKNTLYEIDTYYNAKKSSFT